MKLNVVWMSDMWLGRNVVKHHKQTINNSLGAQLLDIEIEKEYDAGCQDLPVTVHKWFRLPKEDILANSLEYKKGWLVIVKSVRESQKVADFWNIYQSRSLRRWIGLR
jgi:hypothetical protein